MSELLMDRTKWSKVEGDVAQDTVNGVPQLNVLIAHALAIGTIDKHAHRHLIYNAEKISQDTNIPLEHLFGVVNKKLTRVDLKWLGDFNAIRSTYKGILYPNGNDEESLRYIAGLLTRHYCPIGVYTLQQIVEQYTRNFLSIPKYVILEIASCDTLANEEDAETFLQFIADCLYKKFFLLLSMESSRVFRDIEYTTVMRTRSLGYLGDITKYFYCVG